MNSPLEKPEIVDDFFDRVHRSDTEFEITLGTSDIFVFRGAQDASELYAQRKQAEDFAKAMMDGKVSEAMKPYLIRDIRTLYYVAMLSALHVGRFRETLEPKKEDAGSNDEKTPPTEQKELVRSPLPKFTQADFLRLANHNANWFDAIRSEVDQRLGVETSSQMLAAVLAAKKE